MMTSIQKFKRLSAIVTCVILPTWALAQEQVPTQTVRGIVNDKISQSPLAGAAVVVLNSNPFLGAVTDENGNFSISKVPVGKQTFKISYLGYKTAYLQNISVNAGKELVLNIGLEEDVTKMNDVVVTATFEKNKPLNDMSVVSTRTFSVEETQKFAAAVNDPARMATSFAGVVATDDGNNGISIRGNSPNGLLWRMEGVDIPNPNHFSSLGSSGGGISILSAQLLNNSDFSSGAFAAEYGNALSGVFDLKLRKGNNQKREYTFQAGLLGLDFASEGPFKKGYGGSYLVNYRYSTLSLLGKVGVPLGYGTTNFQDLSFNVFLPAGKAGSFSIFGFGGLSDDYDYAQKDSAKWKEDPFYQYENRFSSYTGAAGISHTKLFKNQGYLKTAVVFSGTLNGGEQEKLNKNYVSEENYFEEYIQSKIAFNSTYTQKLSAKSNIRAGFILSGLHFSLRQKDRDDTTHMVERINGNGNTSSVQAFFQWNYRINGRLSSNLGLHYIQLMLNNSKALEPRASLKYELSEKSSLSLGYGLHSQLQPIALYFVKDLNSNSMPNKQLGLSRAHHLVAGYDFNLNSYSHIKTEVYYQDLFQVPVSMGSNYSVLNGSYDSQESGLSNKGKGRNYGTELTYERFLYRNLYYMVSASLYDSKFKASNNKWYNTRYNANYALTITAGKEWPLSGSKNKVIGFNFKSIYVGGFRYTPIDFNASVAKGETVEDLNKTFANKNPDYYRLDIRLSIKRNFKKTTSTLALDIQNTTNRKNIGGQYYDPNTGKIKYSYQTPLIPILSYRIEF